MPNLWTTDQHLQSALINKGIDAQAVIWSDKTVDWTSYDYLIFRNTWDYFEREEEFRSWLSHIRALNVPTLNSLDVVEQNINKFYLKELQDKGVKLIPTVFLSKGQAFDLSKIIPPDWGKAVIKPAFSAGSYLTEVVTTDIIDEMNIVYKELVKTKDLLLQKFMPEVQTAGETSFVFFNRVLSHIVNKMPKEGDFRVQSQFGGSYSTIEQSESIIRQAQSIVDKISGDLLYARVDGIIIADVFYLMEVELIEPDLYLDKADHAIPTFVQAIIEKLSP